MIRKMTHILSCSLIFLSVLCLLTSCGQKDLSEPATESTITEISEPHSSDDDTNVSEIEESSAFLLATDYLLSIYDISDQWFQDAYLVYGMDVSGQECYGIWYTSGEFEQLNCLDDYRACYPMGDGNLLVTNDVNDEGFISSSANDEGFGGRIIDQNGTILFETETSQRMHLINSSAVMVIDATSGFEGVSVQWGIVDNHGEWVHELDDTGPLVEFLEEKNMVKVTSEGTWKYKAPTWSAYGNLVEGVWNIGRIEDYAGNETNYLWTFSQYYDTTLEKQVRILLVYDLDSDQFSEWDTEEMYCTVNEVIQTNPDEWAAWQLYGSETYYLFGIGDKQTGDNMLSDDKWTPSLLDSFTNYVTTVNGEKYWFSYWYATGYATGDVFGLAYTIYSDENPDGYEYSVEESERIEEILWFRENQVCLQMIGADGLDYFAIHDMSGNTIVEPIKMEGFSSGEVVVLGDMLIYYDETSGTLSLLDWESGDIVSTYIGPEDYPSIWALDEERFVVQFEDDGQKETYVFTFTGEQIF